MSSNVRRQQADGPERPDHDESDAESRQARATRHDAVQQASGSSQPGRGLSARDAAVARKARAGNAGYVVQHTLIHNATVGWAERRVVTPEDLVDADVDEDQIARLDRLKAWRPATSEELQAAADAKTAAEDAGIEFTGYFVPADQAPEATPQSAVVGERA
jgi:hypothetical protein